MNRIIKTVSRCFLPLLLVTGASSCLREDKSDCPVIEPEYNVRVVVELPGTETKGYYDFEVECIDLYVFNEGDGKYVAGYKQLYKADAETEFFFDLPAGDYRFIAWTNHCSSYELSHSREQCLAQGITYRDMILSLALSGDRTVLQDMPDLHFGHLTDARVENERNHEFTVRTIPYTNIINLTTEGLPEKPAGYTLCITDDNSHYTFDNNYVSYDDASQRTLQYQRTFSTNGQDKMKASMKVLRLTDPDIYPDKTNPVLRITDNSVPNPVYEKDLIELIKKTYSQASQALDFDRETVFDIVIKFDANMEATVSVNGWNVSEQPGELE